MKKESDNYLSWELGDIEQRVGLQGGRFTRVNGLFSFLIAVGLTGLFYGFLFLLGSKSLSGMFIERSFSLDSLWIPTLIAFFSFWCLAILFIKSRKLAFQRRALALQVMPEEPGFVLSSATVDEVRENIYTQVDIPRNFVLFNRIMVALANLKNLGQVADIENILRAQGERDEASTETSFAMLHGFVWAIPVMGFIGTVVGLSVALGGFGEVLESAKEVKEITESLKLVTGGLKTAFDTTLQGLVAALFISLVMTRQKKAEEEFLDECAEYCTLNIVGKLRILPYETSNS